MRKIRILTSILLTGLASVAWSQGSDKLEFTTINAPDAGALLGQGTVSQVISQTGWITGEYQDSNNVIHGFVRTSGGKITEFDPPGSLVTITAGINVEGMITGAYQDQAGSIHAYIRNPDGRFTIFDALDTKDGPAQSTFAASINIFGTASAWVYDDQLALHGLLRHPDGSQTNFDVPGAGTGFLQGTYVDGATGLTDLGTISGYWADSNSVWHGFFRSPWGEITKFDAPAAGTQSGQGSLSDSINQENWIVGTSIDANYISHGFVRSPDGKITVFDAPNAGTRPGQGTIPQTNNDANEIVGFFIDANNVNHGFLREPNGKITEFDAPGAGSGPPLGFGVANNYEPGQGTVGSTLNDAGVVTGFYVDENNLSHGYVLNVKEDQPRWPSFFGFFN